MYDETDFLNGLAAGLSATLGNLLMVPLPSYRVYFRLSPCTSSYSDATIDEYGVYFNLTGDGAEIEKAAVFVERIENVYWGFAPAVKANERTLSVHMTQYIAYKNSFITQTIFGASGPWYSSESPPLPDLKSFSLWKNNAGIYSRSVYPPYMVSHTIYMPGDMPASTSSYGSGAYTAYDMDGRFQGSAPVPGQESLHLLENADAVFSTGGIRVFFDRDEMSSYIESP